MGPYIHCAGQLTASQHLNQRLLADQAVGMQRLGRDLVETALLHSVEVDCLVLDPERVLEALELRNPLMERHLATFEADTNGVAGPLALTAPACGLAALAADAPSHTLGPLLRTGRWLQVMNSHVTRPPRPVPPPGPGEEPGQSFLGSHHGQAGCCYVRSDPGRAHEACPAAWAWRRWHYGSG